MAAKVEDWKTNAFDIPVHPVEMLCSYCGKRNPKSRCSNCKVTYCNRKCQTDAWPTHKIFCKQSIQHILDYITDTTFVSRMLYLGGIMTKYATELGDASRIEYVMDELRNANNLEFHRLETTEEVYADGVGDVQTEELAVFGSNPDYVPLITKDNAILFSGCSTIEYFPLALSINLKSLSVTAEMIALTSFMLFSIHVEKTKEPSLLHTIPMRTNDLYEISYGPYSLKKFFKNRVETKPNVGIYTIHLSSFECEDAHRDYEDVNDLWESVTSKKPKSEHYLMILQVNDSSCIIQSYFGHYTFFEWCNFSSALVRIKTPEAKNKEWFREVLPHPKYRGILNFHETMNLCEDLEKLTEEGVGCEERIQLYANIVGVLHTPESIEGKFAIRFAYMDLNRIILK